MDLFLLINIFEILAINTYTTYSCSRKKWSPLISILLVISLTVINSILLLFIYRFFWGTTPFNGKGIIALFGFLYVIPLKYCFDQSFKEMIIIMTSSWIYTTFAFVFAVQVGYVFPIEKLPLSTLIAQTIFFVVTLTYYIKFVKKFFSYIFQNLKKQIINSILIISLSWFFLIFLINYIFVEGSSVSLKFLILFIILVNSILSYKMTYYFVSTNNKAETLSHITKIDPLTHLKNRESLYYDLSGKIESKLPFSLIFVDLDDFKSINDRYGHSIGDEYIKEFTKEVSKFLNVSDSLYRLHGDEFIIYTENTEVWQLCNEIKNLTFYNFINDINFKGLSFGYALFPEDGNKLNDLLHIADLKMYQEKKLNRNR
ncbi:MAG: GGDEF domain-containing protein [Proteocatella sp.]